MHRNRAVAALSITASVALAFAANAALAHPGHDEIRRVQTDAAPAPAHPHVVVYVNRGGGTVSPGDDDSARGTSSLVEHGMVKVPPWKGGEQRWKQVMSCVRDRFSPFDLEITEERPQSGDYIMAYVGGQPSLLGYSRDVSGIAPYTGDVMSNAIVYIFAAGVDYDVEITCVDVLHEVGHALGLDHEYMCQDPMSYLWDCDEPKTFQDADASCGEDDPRACEDGAKTQNSFRMLARNVGLRGGGALPAEPATPPATGDPPGDGAGDTAGDPPPTEPSPAATSAPSGAPAPDPDELTVSLDGPSGVVAGNRMLTVTVHGRGPRVTDAALAWVSTDGRFTFDCNAMPAGAPATCHRKGDDFVFRLEVGTGWRYFAAVVVDAAGYTASSDPASVYLQ